MKDKNIALVLGAGGAAGNAWLIGVIAGLAEAGVDMRRLADLVIGTSAGATAATQLRGDIPLPDLLAATVAPLPASFAQNRGPPPTERMNRTFERMRAISAESTSALDMQRRMGAFGLECDAELGPEAGARWRSVVASRLSSPDWPQRLMQLVAIDAQSGEVELFDRDSGVELVEALAAATSLPGGLPTREIKGRRYITGGARSPDNADLAAGYANVLILSPLSGRTGPLPEGQFEGLQRPPEWGMDLEGQIKTLRDQGSRVWAITPDEASREAMGTNQMDPATRPPSARAGYEQGRREAGRITFV